MSVRGLRHNIDHGQSHWNGLRSDAVHVGFTLSAETDQPTDVGCVGGQSARVSDRELSRNHDMRYTSESPCRTNGRLRDGPSMARKGMLRRATGGNASGVVARHLTPPVMTQSTAANRGLTHWSGSSSTPWICHLTSAMTRLIDAGRRGLSRLARVVGKLTCGGLAPAAESDRTLQR